MVLRRGLLRARASRDHGRTDCLAAVVASRGGRGKDGRLNLRKGVLANKEAQVTAGRTGRWGRPGALGGGFCR